MIAFKVWERKTIFPLMKTTLYEFIWLRDKILNGLKNFIAVPTYIPVIFKC